MVEEVKALFLFSVIIILLFLLFIIGVVLLYRRRQSEILLKSQLEEEKHKIDMLKAEISAKKKLEEERERISLDLHDDLGANLSVIGLKADFLKSTVTDPHTIEGLSEIVKNTHDINISMREMMWSLNAHKNNVGEFSNYVKQYVANYFENTGIKAHIDIPESLESYEMSSYLRRQLFLCIKEACHNIIKHSDASEMHLVLDWVAPKINIHIKDNGVGIQSSKPHGNGLYSMHKRIKELDGHIKIDHHEPKGTKIHMSVPLD